MKDRTFAYFSQLTNPLFINFLAQTANSDAQLEIDGQLRTHGEVGRTFCNQHMSGDKAFYFSIKKIGLGE